IYDSIPLQHFDFLYKNWYTIDIFAILLDWKRADFTKIREKLLKREGTLFENGMSMGKQDINTSIEKIKEFLTNTKSIPLAMISSIKEKLPKNWLFLK
ncbi:MAG: hypothetical protein J7L80_02475, partial [Thermoplasmata archaeon]|nr:hypothetical protein [Thermoplasmata archaeon]